MYNGQSLFLTSYDTLILPTEAVTDSGHRCCFCVKYLYNEFIISRLLPPSLACNGNCSCDPTAFTPVCGSDGLNYFSPCYAGCQLESRSDNKTVTYLHVGFKPPPHYFLKLLQFYICISRNMPGYNFVSPVVTFA